MRFDPTEHEDMLRRLAKSNLEHAQSPNEPDFNPLYASDLTDEQVMMLKSIYMTDKTSSVNSVPVFQLLKLGNQRTFVLKRTEYAPKIWAIAIYDTEQDITLAWASFREEFGCPKKVSIKAPACLYEPYSGNLARARYRIEQRFPKKNLIPNGWGDEIIPIGFLFWLEEQASVSAVIRDQTAIEAWLKDRNESDYTEVGLEEY